TTYVAAAVHGQQNSHGRAFADDALQLDRPAVLVDNPAADGQSQAGAFVFLFRRKERVHDLGNMLRRNSNAGIGNLDDKGPPAVGEFAAMHEWSKATAVRHGVAGIRNQVQEQLTQLLPVGVNNRQVRCEFKLNLDIPFFQVMVRQFQHTPNFGADINAG